LVSVCGMMTKVWYWWVLNRSGGDVFRRCGALVGTCWWEFCE